MAEIKSPIVSRYLARLSRSDRLSAQVSGRRARDVDDSCRSGRSEESDDLLSPVWFVEYSSGNDLRLCPDDLNLLPSRNLANGFSPKLIEFLLGESLRALAADSLLKFVFGNGRGVLLLTILGNKLSALILGSSFSEFFNGFVSYSLDASCLLAIWLTCGWDRNQTTKRQRMWLEEEAMLTAN
ncbi:hypothetical protein HG531_002456 [Fusarium graminearum]|nr:hypothetical protein HG531_002456 [Fusarium graminearum]